MRKKIRTLFILILSVHILSVILQAQDSTLSQTQEPINVRLSTEVDKLEVPRNRFVTFIAKVEWSGNINRFEIVESRNPDVENFEIVRNAQAHQTAIENGLPVSRTILEFTLKPLSLGMGYVGDMPIRYRDKVTGDERQLLTNRLGVKVIDAVPEPGSRILFIPQKIFYLIITALAIIAAVILGLRLFLKKRALERKRQQELAAIVPLEQDYLDRLKGEIDLNSADLKTQFSFISRIFREYLAEKFQISAMEVTTPELKSILESQNGDEEFSRITYEILHTCDVVKFGGGQLSPAELARIYTLVENIFDKNKAVMQDKKETVDSDK